MAVTQYIGARYVPRFYENASGTAEWTANTGYEALTIVTRNGNSYTSKKTVPADIGAPETAPDYWVNTGNFNSQLADVDRRIDTIEGQMEDIEDIADGLRYLSTSAPINILSLGAKNDGTEDISSIVNQYTESFPLYLPIGIYRVDQPLLLRNALIGAGCNRNNVLNGYGEHADATVIKSYVQNDYTIKIGGTDNGIIVKDLNISLRSGVAAGGITQNSTASSRGFIQNVGIYGLSTATGIFINPTVSTSRACFIDNVSIFGDGHANTGSIGIRASSTAYDNRITNTEIMYVQRGIQIDAGLVYGSDIHIYTGGVAAGEITQSFYEGTSCIYSPSVCFLNFSNIYCDSSYRPINVAGTGAASISNFMYWDDQTYDNMTQTGSYIFWTDNRAFSLNVSGGQIFNKYRRPIMESSRLMNASLDGVQIMVDGNPASESEAFAYPMYPAINRDSYTLYNTIHATFTSGHYSQIAMLYSGGGGYTSIEVSDVDNNCVELIYDRLSGQMVHKKTLRGSLDVYYKYENYITKIYVKNARTGTQYSVKVGKVSAYCGIMQYAAWRKLDHTFPTLDDLTSSTGLTSIPELA